MEGKYLSRNTHKDHKDCFRFEEHTHTLHTWGTSSSSWPCRNYVCSFCKREFKSAQALGGHMNVHRRDRARLRSSLSESPKPNPTIIKPNNPTHHLSDADYFLNSCDPLYGPCFTLSASSLSSPPSTSTGDKKPRLSPSHLPFLSPQSKRRSALGFDQKLKGCASMEEEHKVFKNNNDNITLELGIGLLKHPKEKLDLELRLGF